MSELDQSTGKTLPETGPKRSNAQAFSDITTILLRTEPFRSRPLRDLEWLVLPPLVRRQFALAHATPKTDPANDTGSGAGQTEPVSKGPPMPVGLVMWASVSDEIDRKMRADTKSPLIELAVNDWDSGPNAWIIVAAGLPDVLKAMLPQVAQKVFPGQAVHLRVGDGQSYGVQQISKALN